jgi:hypothetical protein
MILMFAVAAAMAAAMAVMAASAFAFANPTNKGKTDDASGQTQQAQPNAGANEDKQSARGISAGGGPKKGVPAPENGDHFYQTIGVIGNE